jgi:hypothetical protein
VSRFWVLEGLFKLHAVRVDWVAEARKLGYEGGHQPAHSDPAPVQLRWLLHPAIGLPREPFRVFRNSHPGGNLTPQQLSELPGWVPVETVGLPVDPSWAQSHYDVGRQGLVGDPLPPVAAARARLDRGAPRIGWTRLTRTLQLGPVSLPDWEPVDLPAYVHELIGSPLLHGIKDMLREQQKPAQHAAYKKTGRGDSFKPQLLLAGAAAHDSPDASGVWHPLGLLLLSVGSDPLASLALGFGTAVLDEESDLYMVTVKHTIGVLGRSVTVRLADVVSLNTQLPAPSPPTDLGARLLSHTRPQTTDAPGLDSVAIDWRRPLNPLFAHLGDDAPYAIAYAIGRFDTLRGAILLTRRSPGVDGWKPFVAGQPNAAAPVTFVDHHERMTTFDQKIVADSLGEDHLYAVAAADIFGRWSGWATTPYTDAREPARAPTIFAASIDPTGRLTVDFGWDWSDRSPQFVELHVSYDDPPQAPLLTARLDFGGSPTPTLTVTPPPGSVELLPLGSNLVELAAGSWGTPQDMPDSPPEQRYYRLKSTTPFAFAGLAKRSIRVQARGQTRVDARRFPNYNISPFGPPFVAEAYDATQPTRPLLPPPPEPPQWATLRDSSGVSRAVLEWPAVVDVAGYVLYEATETTLLAGLGLAGPETTDAFATRLALLRSKDLAGQRRNFRRVREELIPTNSWEVELPRGSTVMHLYAVTAVSRNQIESAWPPNSKQFIAVAAPRTRVPSAPALEAKLTDTPAGPKVDLNVAVGADGATATIELYRVSDDELSRSVDTMGLPIASVPAVGAVVHHMDTIKPGWRRTWYRAAAWSARDDLNGFIEARSAGSAAVSVIAPPMAAPAITDVRVNELHSTLTEALVSWATDAPFHLTPLGGHEAILETHDANGTRIHRLEGRLDTLMRVATQAAVPAPDPANRRIVHVTDAPRNRLYAWLHRPTADQPFRLDLKIIDPLGRIGHFALDVPTIPPTPPPVVTNVDPQQGHTGDQFTISGSDLVIDPGDAVTVTFVGPLEVLGTQDERSIPCRVVQPTSRTAIVVEVPDPESHHDSEDFAVFLKRSDGLEVKVLDDFFLAIL